MATRQEQVLSILERLSAQGGADISGSVAVSMDGIVLASRMSSDINADRVGAVAATMVGVSRRVSTELKMGATEEAILKSNAGLFIVLPAGNQAMLAVNLKQGANLGMVRIEARDAATAISQIIL
ncbi:dynein regulation protein LC7 [Kouleothrix aurantiaca]|jgi:predicted regulator of Ras-like GTPase activity (Roadblock/LC7/MglB family)|uniref:Dynein regulation protein LC7 n=1 Tax=Kouleothrix aurantiaca TaxID=186479 RepID=A0A0P9DD42_9CHLR|nr:dynein regulation protein LC7 [Kouleothrix aurantiaca]